MILDHHESFQRMIDQSLAGPISAEKEQSLREHLCTCAPCKEYLSASNRVIASLSAFSFEVNPALNAKVLAALRLQTQQHGASQRGHRRFMRQHNLSPKAWAAFALALLMSFVGSAVLYQVTKRLAGPMHFASAQVQASVLVFWLVPSLCAAVCLLAAPGGKRGIA